MGNAVWRKLGACLFLAFIATAVITNLSSAQISPLKITVTTDKTSYILREIVDISGNVTYNNELVEEGLVGIQVDNPLTKIVTRTLPLGPISPEGWTIEIVSLISCDNAGNLKLSYERESWAWFMVTVKNSGITSKDALITINVYDSSFIPIGTLFSQTTIEAGENTTFMPSLWIENWVSNGTATAYANVYTDWPKNGGYPYCPEKSTTFTIIESEYDEDPPNQSPNTPTQNGTYDLKFRLSPEPPPGTYVVSASAWYKGWKDTATTSFEVMDVPAAPWPSFAVKPPMAGPGYEITFDASASSAEGYGDSITGYAWNFGDSQNATGKIVKHTYAEIGNYTVTLNVTDTEGFWNTTSRLVTIIILHDVAVIDIQCLTEIYNNWLVSVSVTIKNHGTVTETFNVTLSANSTFIETKQVTGLEPLKSTKLTFAWNTTGLTVPADYMLEATADTLENETNTANNMLSFGPIWARMLGDIMYNRQIDICDIVAITSIYGSKSGDPNWNIMADLNPDGKIDITDVVKATSRYGLKY